MHCKRFRVRRLQSLFSRDKSQAAPMCPRRLRSWGSQVELVEVQFETGDEALSFTPSTRLGLPALDIEACSTISLNPAHAVCI